MNYIDPDRQTWTLGVETWADLGLMSLCSTASGKSSTKGVKMVLT